MVETMSSNFNQFDICKETARIKNTLVMKANRDKNINHRINNISIK